jgi:Putative Ig domain
MPSFPTVTLLDPFTSNENPLSNGGKWKQFFPAGSNMGRTNGTAWETISASIPEGAYWHPIEFSNPGVALEWAVRTTDNTYWKLWACVSNPTSSSINGYVLQLKHEGSGSSHKFEVKLEKCAANVFTELGKVSAIEFAVGDRFGLSVQEGKVIAWRKKGGGEWEELLSKADSSYTTGYVGFVAEAGFGDIINFEAGSAGGGGSSPSVENPGKQHARTFKSTSLQIHALNVTKYFATNLPLGLSISESTGLITGEFETEESPVVKIKVENEKAETAETSFEWIVTTTNSNVLSMIVC